MTDEKTYLGRPGHLVEIPHPRGGVDNTRVRLRSKFVTGGGGARVGQIVGGKRQYTLTWESLWYEDFALLLEACDQGHNGVGPFAFLDPGRINWLTVNQSAATSETNDSDNFTAAGSGVSLSSSSTVFERGPRALQVNFTFAASGTVDLDSATDEWPGVPVVDRAIVFWADFKGGGTDAVMTVTAQLRWWDADAVLLSTTSGTPIVTSSSAWTQALVTASPPANAVYVSCRFTVTGTSAGSILYGDYFQLQEGSAPTDWRPGTGVLPMAIMSLSERWPWTAPDYRANPVMVLQEVGA